MKIDSKVETKDSLLIVPHTKLKWVLRIHGNVFHYALLPGLPTKCQCVTKLRSTWNRKRPIFRFGSFHLQSWQRPKAMFRICFVKGKFVQANPRTLLRYSLSRKRTGRQEVLWIIVLWPTLRRRTTHLYRGTLRCSIWSGMPILLETGSDGWISSDSGTTWSI